MSGEVSVTWNKDSLVCVCVVGGWMDVCVGCKGVCGWGCVCIEDVQRWEGVEYYCGVSLCSCVSCTVNQRSCHVIFG